MCSVLQCDTSLESQLSAVRYDGFAIKFMNSPCYEVQLEAITKQPLALNYIPNASLELQLLALSREILSFSYITDLRVFDLIDGELEKLNKPIFDYQRLDLHGNNLLHHCSNSDIVNFLLNKGLVLHDNCIHPYTTALVQSVIRKRNARDIIIFFLRKCKWYRLAWLVRKKMFCEWYYAPENEGGKRAKMWLSNII
jgi:hypothetical protein